MLDSRTIEGKDPLVGRLLDRYRVLERIGEGGMGTVYAVEHVMLRKRMALKLLRADLTRDEDLVARFQNEAIAAGGIGQENIVAVTDFGRTAENQVFIVMEELHGPSLAEVIHTEGALELGRVLSISSQICRALQAAHAAGIVHRDLKPENVILVAREGPGELVKVLDFGISKMSEADGRSISPSGHRLTQSGMIVGTPEYMAPEQAAGRAIDRRADIYSFGVVLFEMLTGQLPFHGENTVQVLMKHQTEDPPTLAATRPDLEFSEALEAVVEAALAKRPEDRQHSMAECLTGLQRCASGVDITQPDYTLGPGGRASPLPGRAPFLGSPTLISSEPPGEPTGEPELLLPRRSRGPWIVLAVLALGALGAVLWSSLGRSPSSDPASIVLVPESSAAIALPAPPSLDEATVAAPVVPAIDAVSPPKAVERPRKWVAAHERPRDDAYVPPPSPAVAPPAAPVVAPVVAPDDPYQKVDDLKAAY